MGMTKNQLALVRYVAENNMQKAKDAALCCCAEYGKPRKEVVWMNYSDTQLSFADFPEVLP